MAAIEAVPQPRTPQLLSHLRGLEHNSKAPPRWRSMVSDPSFYIAKFKLSSSIDPITKRYIRNGADERAAAMGMRFSEQKGQFTVDWVSKYCTLYEGDKAGQLMDIDDWQYEYFMQVFGWQAFDDERGQWKRRFKRASIWIPKKNAKSPTLAATGLYLLIGEGEMGQKCYSVARDGKQAMISHSHAMRMVEFSEALSRECKINRTTGDITHRKTHSHFLVVSGENKKSTEGYNGSLLVDETHVVDDELIKRLKRAGISRRQPLHIEMSTAGDNTDGYGYTQYDFGRENAKGETDKCRLNFYFLEFGVHQETPVDFFNGPTAVENMKSIAHRVNPTLGRILSYNEFMEDHRDSLQSEKEAREFAMYRANLWMHSAVTWIPMADWKKCGRQYTLRELVEGGYPCTGGIDLSKTRDMTAFTLCFGVPDEDRGIIPHLWTWAWWPQEQARRYANKLDWGRFKRTLTLVPERAINYEVIADKLEWCRKNLDFRGFAFDPFNSDTLVNILANDYGWDEEQMVAVKQTMPYMGPLSREFERMVLREDLRYAQQQTLLDWQIGHCYTIGDKFGNVRPIKPPTDDFKKIDTVISQILALAKFNNDPDLACGYTDSLILVRAQEAAEARTDTDFRRDEDN